MTEQPKPKKLTPLQKRFCEEYVIDFNGAGAARRAGYGGKQPGQQAYLWLRMDHIKAEVRRLQESLTAHSVALRERMLAELVTVGLSNIEDYCIFDANGVIINDSANIPRGTKAAIAEIAQSETPSGVQVKIKLHDKLAAIAATAKMLGWNEPEKATVTNINMSLEELKKLDPAELARLHRESLGEE